MTKGEKLRLLRETKKLTREALGKEIGYSPQMIYKIESGEKEPSMKFLNTVISYFGVSLSFFINEVFDDVMEDIKLKDLKTIILEKPDLQYNDMILNQDERSFLIDVINSSFNLFKKYKK